MPRKKLKPKTETIVLTRSVRRCALCFGLNGDLGIKKGQLAHVDRDNTNDSVENLVFLCLAHHDEYDSTTSQSKGFTATEVKHYKEVLTNAVRTGLGAGARVQAREFEQNERRREQDEAVKQHDSRRFSEADTILTEHALLRLLDALRNDHSYRGSQASAIESYIVFFRETGNQFLTNDLQRSRKSLVTALDRMLTFIELQFFVYPEGQASDSDWRYCLHPEFNMDRAWRGDMAKLEKYDQLTSELNRLCSTVGSAYDRHRLAIKQTLTV